MKKLLIALISMASTSAFAHGDTCVAELIQKVAYGINSKYLIYCGEKNPDFEVNSFFHFNLKGELIAEMKKRGYKEDLAFQPKDKHPRNDRTSYRAFRKEELRSLKSICAVTYGNREYIKYANTFLYDFVIACDDNTNHSEYVSGDSIENTALMMEKRGYAKAFEFEANQRGFYNAQTQKTIVGKTIIYQVVE